MTFGREGGEVRPNGEHLQAPRKGFFLARAEVGGKNLKMGLTADHHMATRGTPGTNQGYTSVQWDLIDIYLVGRFLKEIGSRTNLMTNAFGCRVFLYF